MLHRNTEFIDCLDSFSLKLGASYIQPAFVALSVSCYLFVFNSRGVLSICLLYHHLSVIFDHWPKGLHNVKSIPSYMVGDNADRLFPLMDWLGSPCNKG